MASKLSSQDCIAKEHKYGAHNYHPLPVVFAKAQGVNVWDPEGKKYLDFLSAYSAVNQGHSHPKIIKALIDQAQSLCLSSRAFYNDRFCEFAQVVTELFGFDMVLPMNTGAEAVETAIKLARKWGYLVKKIPANEAIVLAVDGNFHGRTIGIISMSTDETATKDFGPFLPNVGPNCVKGGRTIRYNHIEDLEAALKAHGDKVAAFLVEPIQGEAGIFVPDEGYMLKAYELCKKHNVLFIADEIQTGLARTGRLLAIEHEVGVKPDMVILGKALSGGVYPVSCVLANKEVMLTIKAGEHGSTYGGNPLGAAVAIAALKVIKDENLVERAEKQGQKFRDAIRAINSPVVQLVRGRGLLNAIVIDESKTGGKSAWDLCLLLKHHGLLAKPTHRNIIRLAPPLVITDEEVAEGIAIIKKALEAFPTLKVSQIPGAEEDHNDDAPAEE